MILALWLTEIALELAGLGLAYRRRLHLLASLLAIRAFFDFATLAIRYSVGFNQTYAWVWLIGQIAQAALLTVLVCTIAAKLFKEYRPANEYACLLGLLVASITIAAWIRADALLDKWLDGQIACGAGLAGALLLALGTRKGSLDRQWGWITAGTAVQLVGMIATAILWQAWAPAVRFYTVPGIVALALWNWSAKPNFKLSEIRSWQAIPKKPVESVKISLQARRSGSPITKSQRR